MFFLDLNGEPDWIRAQELRGAVTRWSYVNGEGEGAQLIFRKVKLKTARLFPKVDKGKEK